MSLPSNVQTPKSFWKRPEGKTGMLFAMGGLAALGIGLYKILPFVITLLQNAITATALAVALGAMLWVLLDKKNWILAEYFYKSLMRKITQVFVEIDPIGIMRNYVDDLKKQREKMQKQISNLRGQVKILQRQIQQNERERNNALSMAQQAQKKEKRGVFALKARQAGRLQESNLKLEDLLQKMELLFRVLGKMREASDLMIEDIENEVEHQDRERKMIKAAHSAMASAKAILQGSPDRLALFEQAMEFTAEDYGRKLGEIEEFVDMSTNFIDTLDLQNGVFEQEALDLLSKWEDKTESILLGDGKKQIIEETNDPGNVLDVDAPQPVSRRQGRSGRYFQGN